MHRVGYHFKSQIFEEACENLKYTVDYRTGEVKAPKQPEEDPLMAEAFRALGVTFPTHFNQPGKIVENSATVMAVFRELFPQMPKRNIFEAIVAAWNQVISIQPM